MPEEIASRRLDGETRYGAAATVDMNLGRDGTTVLLRRNKTGNIVSIKSLFIYLLRQMNKSSPDWVVLLAVGAS